MFAWNCCLLNCCLLKVSWRTRFHSNLKLIDFIITWIASCNWKMNGKYESIVAEVAVLSVNPEKTLSRASLVSLVRPSCLLSWWCCFDAPHSIHLTCKLTTVAVIHNKLLHCQHPLAPVDPCFMARMDVCCLCAINVTKELCNNNNNNKNNNRYPYRKNIFFSSNI